MAKNIFKYAFFTFLVLLLWDLNYWRYFHMAGDSAGYVDLIRRAAHFSDFKSKVLTAPYPIFDLMNRSASEYCNSDLINKYENLSFLKWHQYLIAWIFGVISLRTGLDALILAPLLSALSVVVTFAIVNKILEKLGFNFFEKVLLILSIIFFPPVLGSISGQYYFERLFIPFTLSIYYLLTFYNGKYKYVYLFILVIFADLVTERASLMTGVFLMAYPLLHKTKNIRVIVLLGVGSIVNYFIWRYFIQDSFYQGSTSVTAMLENFRSLFDMKNELSIKSINFIYVLLPFLLISIFSWKHFLIALLFMLPNFLVTVGGAEKVGFLTHYHSLYIPLLIISFLNGASRLKYFLSKNLLTTLIFALILSYNFYFYVKNKYVVSPTLTHDIFTDSAILIPGTPLRNFTDIRRAKFTELLNGVDQNTFISTNEFPMPILVSLGFQNIRFFPMGVESSEYLITENNIDTNENFMLAIIADPKTIKDVEICLREKVLDKYERIGQIDLHPIRYTLWKIKPPT